jgi:hypothetical protein
MGMAGVVKHIFNRKTVSGRPHHRMADHLLILWIIFFFSKNLYVAQFKVQTIHFE